MNGIALGVFVTSAVATSLRARQRQHASNKTGESQKFAMEQLLSTTNQRVYKFVLTGGPCSGKTTALERLQVFLRERGFRVLVAPEVATMGLTNGACVDDFARSESAFAFQQFVINSQLTLEDSLVTYAKTLLVDTVVLCDRGVMDGSAYVDGESWQKVLEYANQVSSYRDKHRQTDR
jgi:predicted ATPase